MGLCKKYLRTGIEESLIVLVLPVQGVSFAALERKAQYHREIALGVFRKPQGKESPRATLLPERQAVFTLDEASYLVVITSLSTSDPQENTDE